MARDPGSVWAPLPEAGAPDGYVKTQFIVHSTGDNGLARSVRDNWFARGDVVVESTFIVGWGPSRNDPTLQIMDSTDHADANGSANQRGISIEVVGDGVGPFTDWQVSELHRLGLWARQTHGVLPRICPSEAAGGFGWHVMFGAPGPWTTVRGKVCPGARRIEQLKTVIFPAIFAGGPIAAEDDDMAFGDNERRLLQETKNIADALLSVAERPIEVERRLNVRLDALTGIVQQLATQQGTPIDMAAVEAVVEKGVQDAIAGIETTVTVKTDA